MQALLGAAIESQILEADDLVDLVSEIISARLARATTGIMLPRDKLKDACKRSLREDPRVGADIVVNHAAVLHWPVDAMQAIMSRDPAAISYIQTVMFFKVGPY